IVRGTVGAGDVVVRGDNAGQDSTAGLNRDVSRAYEVTKDDEHRTDLYVTKSSVEAVSPPSETAKEWVRQFKGYDETAKQNYESASRDLTRAINKLEASLGRKLDPVISNRMGDDFAEQAMDALLRGGLTAKQAKAQLADPAFQKTVIEEIGKIAGIDLEPLKPLSEKLQAEAGSSNSLALLLPATDVQPDYTLAQSMLKSMATINDYLGEHPEQTEAVGVLIAMAQGPKGVAQLIVYDSLAGTPAGQIIIGQLSEYSELVGKKIAVVMEGNELDENIPFQASLIGGGRLISSVVIGAADGLKGAGKQKTVSAGSQKKIDNKEDLAPEKGGPKVPKNVEKISNPPQAPVIPAGWVSRPGKNGGEIYFPPGTDPAKGEHIRVMPPGSSAVPGYENGYWRWQNSNKQAIDPATGKPGKGQGDTHIPLPPNSLPPLRR
ncbi:hypothetical protein HCG45_02400, partial [Pseudomonas fulva]|nr:hypothetical protein [Pseudomonas fulva]